MRGQPREQTVNGILYLGPHAAGGRHKGTKKIPVAKKSSDLEVLAHLSILHRGTHATVGIEIRVFETSPWTVIPSTALL